MSKSGRPREFKDNAVIDAAMEVFWDNGYEACSTEALCNKAGLGREACTMHSAANTSCMNRPFGDIMSWESRSRWKFWRGRFR